MSRRGADGLLVTYKDNNDNKYQQMQYQFVHLKIQTQCFVSGGRTMLVYVCGCAFKLLNQMNNFKEIWNECYATCNLIVFIFNN